MTTRYPLVLNGTTIQEMQPGDTVPVDSLPTTVVQTGSPVILTGLKLVKTAPTISAGVVTLDLNAANFFAISLTANISSFTVTNVPATGTYAEFIIEFTADGTARTVTWTLNSVASRFPSGTAPTLTSTSGKKDTFIVYTHDGGTSWMVYKAGLNS